MVRRVSRHYIDELESGFQLAGQRHWAPIEQFETVAAYPVRKLTLRAIYSNGPLSTIK